MRRAQHRMGEASRRQHAYQRTRLRFPRIVRRDLTASRSLSLASTRRFSAFAAAMARMPVPVPMSRTMRGRSPLQQIVEREKATARAGMMSRAEGLARVDLDGEALLGMRRRSWLPCTRKRPPRPGRASLATASPNRLRGSASMRSGPSAPSPLARAIS